MQIKRKEIVSCLYKYLQGQWGKILLLWIATALTQLYLLINPQIYGLLIQNVIMQKQKRSMVVVGVGLALIYLLRFVGDWLKIRSNNQIENNLVTKLRKEIFDKIFKKTYSEFLKKDNGDWRLNLLEDVELVSSFISKQLVEYYIALAGCILCAILLLKMNWLLTIMEVAIVIVFFVIQIAFGKKQGKIMEKIRQIDTDYYSFEFRTFQNWKEIRAEQGENVIRNEYDTKLKTKATWGLKQIKYWCINEILNEFELNYLCKVCIYILSIPFMLHSRLMLSEVIVFVMYFQSFYMELSKIKDANINLNIYSSQYKRIIELLNEKNQDNKEYKGKVKQIIMNNVDFSYHNSEKLILKNFSTIFRENSKYMICGKSGTGKSTLLMLLAGIYFPNNGKMLVNDSNNYKVNREKMGVVFQNDQLYHESIVDNICVGEKFDPVKWNKVISDCCLQNVIKQHGKNYIIHENGGNLSGGERQRILIARQLYKQPEILILDEATCALDLSTEGRIFENICNINTLSMVIFVTHREDMSRFATKQLYIK